MLDDLGGSDVLLSAFRNIDVVLSQSHLDAAVGKKRHGRKFLSVTADTLGQVTLLAG